MKVIEQYICTLIADISIGLRNALIQNRVVQYLNCISMESAIIIILKSLFTVYYGIGIIYQYKVQ